MADTIPENMTAEEKAAKDPAVDMPLSASWIKEIDAAHKALEKWHQQANKITKRFLDVRESGEEHISKLNLFTTNTQILISTLYAKFPKPLVTREFEDQDDDVARVSANMMERMLQIKERDDFDESMKLVVQDRLVPGLGQMWFRYEPTIVQETIPEQAETTNIFGEVVTPATPEQTFERVVDEEVLSDYVYWEDFLFSPARTWKDVRWVARKVKMNRADVEERFSPEIAKQLTFKNLSAADSDKADTERADPIQYAEVYELWCRRTRKVYWVSKGFDKCLDMREDPLQLPDFFPCPKPLLALTATNKLVPRPDYLLVQDQYRELDDINNRIVQLQRAVKVAGAYDKVNAEIPRLLTESAENILVPMANFRQFAEGGGFKGSIDWLPLDQIVKAIEALKSYRVDLTASIYELTGISDIMRGSSKASETLGAQQLKAQYGSVRLQFLQMEVASFVEEAMEIKANIIRHHFLPETIVARSNIERTPDAPFVQEALQLLKDPMCKYRIQVHADSMAVPEFNAERDARLNFLRAVSEFLTSTQGITAQAPESAPYLLKMVQWAGAGFRVGRGIESVMDEFINSINKKLATPPAPPPPPAPDVVAKAKDLEASAMQRGADAQLKGAEIKKVGAETMLIAKEIMAPPEPPSPPPAP